LRAAPSGKKILAFAPASKFAAPASSDETAFNDSFAVLENLDTDIDPRAPKPGAETSQREEQSPNASACRTSSSNNTTAHTQARELKPVQLSAPDTQTLTELAQQLRRELEPTLTTIAAEAAQREHERTRAWLEKRGLPKAARVAQHEAYKVLRQYGVIKGTARSYNDKSNQLTTDTARGHEPLTHAELEELASTCLAMFEVHGQAIDVTLEALRQAADGRLSEADVAKVRALIEVLNDAGASQP
jgi:hypothetical protein